MWFCANKYTTIQITRQYKSLAINFINNDNSPQNKPNAMTVRCTSEVTKMSLNGYERKHGYIQNNRPIKTFHNLILLGVTLGISCNV